jgi:EAL domain-containing protein (putative c-di-GMP-specific phosphodiesterase class I)
MQKDHWYFEGYFSGNNVLGRLPLNHFPFRIGRDTKLDFTVPSNSTSRIHAIINREGNRLLISDNRSTNGTYVNRQRLIDQHELRHGDIVHFADFEVRVIRDRVEESADPTLSMAALRMENLSRNMPAGVLELQELLERKLVLPMYQAIVEAGTQKVYAYEVLGRGIHPALSANPGPLFRIAESLAGHTVPLSQLFREVGVARAVEQTADEGFRYFLNIHPDELNDVGGLLKHLGDLKLRFPAVRMVLEIHEKAVTDIQNMKIICQGLDELGIELAYDDFGAGQTRFIELIEAPAHYLKFDISLVGNIDKAQDAKRNIVKMLVNMSKDMGISTLAEGLDRVEEVQVCQDLGFDYIQGFYFGRPKERIN